MDNLVAITLVFVILALLVGILVIMPDMTKQDTYLNFISESTINEGDSIEIQLLDADGNPLANQMVNVTVTDKNYENGYYSVTTNENGIASFKLDAGEYDVSISYCGNEDYNGCNSTKRITIEEEIIEESASRQSIQSSSSSDELFYDEEINVYYDSNGIVVDPDGQHGQGVGSKYSDLRDTRDNKSTGFISFYSIYKT